MRLEGMSAVVTGGSARIGRGYALKLAKARADDGGRPAREPLMDFKEKPTHERVAEMGTGAVSSKCKRRR